MNNPRGLKIKDFSFEIQKNIDAPPRFLIKNENGEEIAFPEVHDLKNLRDLLNIYIYEANIYKVLNENSLNRSETSLN